jgi:hypothetical protein
MVVGFLVCEFTKAVAAARPGELDEPLEPPEALELLEPLLPQAARLNAARAAVTVTSVLGVQDRDLITGLPP